jgi:branched-chain amino acid transport system substrate-binding protein
MRTLRLILTLLLILIVGLPGPPAAAQSVPGVTADEIKIGALGALTGPGYLYGRLIMNGAEVVYNEVNKAGGVHGRKIVLVREDDRCDAASAIAAAKKLIFQHQVFMLHGGGCSNASIAARPEVEKANVPWVVFASVADEVTLPTAPYIFSTALAASIESAAQLEFALQQGAKRVAVISMRDAWAARATTPSWRRSSGRASRRSLTRR